MGSRRGLTSAAVLALLLVGAAAGATRDNPRLMLRRVTRPGLDSRLVQIAEAQQRGGQSTALSVARAQGLGVARNRVRVIVESQSGRVSSAQAAVEQAGGSVVATADGLIEALVPTAALEALATSPGVDRVRPPATMQLEAVDEGVASTNANVWQVAGNDGTGVKIAI